MTQEEEVGRAAKYKVMQGQRIWERADATKAGRRASPWLVGCGHLLVVGGSPHLSWGLSFIACVGSLPLCPDVCGDLR